MDPLARLERRQQTTTMAVTRRIKKMLTANTTIITTKQFHPDGNQVKSFGLLLNLFRWVTDTFEVDAAFFSSKPFVADARHLVGGRFEDATSVSVTLLAVLTFSCKTQKFELSIVPVRLRRVLFWNAASC